MKTQILTRNEAYQAEVYYDGWAWIATEENYDGPEDHYRSVTGKTKEEAIENLVESLGELEERNKEEDEAYPLLKD